MNNFRRRALQSALVVLGQTLVTGMALAQDTAPAQDTGSTAAPALEQVVVTAQRREQNLQDVPISVTAMSQDQMDAQGVRSIDDIAKLTPGITFQRADARNGAMSTISIR